MGEVVLSKNEFNLGDIHIDSTVSDSLHILEGIEHIHYVSVSPSCNCTDAKIINNELRVEYTPKISFGNLAKGERKSKPTYILLSLYPWMNEYVAGEGKKKELNPNKTQIRIPLNFVVYG